MTGKSKKKKKTVDDYKKENIFMKAAIGEFCRDCVVPVKLGGLTMRCPEEACALFPHSPLRKKEYPVN